MHVKSFLWGQTQGTTEKEIHCSLSADFLCMTEPLRLNTPKSCDLSTERRRGSLNVSEVVHCWNFVWGNQWMPSSEPAHFPSKSPRTWKYFSYCQRVLFAIEINASFKIMDYECLFNDSTLPPFRLVSVDSQMNLMKRVCNMVMAATTVLELFSMQKIKFKLAVSDPRSKTRWITFKLLQQIWSALEEHGKHFSLVLPFPPNPEHKKFK